MSETVDVIFVSCTCAASEWRRFVQQTYAEEVKVNEILRVDVEQTHREDIHRVILISCFHDLFGIVWDVAFIELRVALDDVAVVDV